MLCTKEFLNSLFVHKRVLVSYFIALTSQNCPYRLIALLLKSGLCCAMFFATLIIIDSLTIFLICIVLYVCSNYLYVCMYFNLVE